MLFGRWERGIACPQNWNRNPSPKTRPNTQAMTTSDRVIKKVRSQMMAGISGRDTKPELVIRSALHRLGFRFRLYCKDLPGKPDMVFPKHRAVIFVNGCFWHGHGCHLFNWPKTRRDFWKQKITSNILRDRRQLLELKQSGWRVGWIWECALKGRGRCPVKEVADRCAIWLKSEVKDLNVRGKGR